MKEIELITDGACRGNPGPGGWGAILRYKSKEKELCGGEANTTNNRMELRAVIEGLGALRESCNVSIITDSKYVKNGIESWIGRWKKNNWRTSNKIMNWNKSLGHQKYIQPGDSIRLLVDVTQVL